jgi:hypothetical protein
LRHCVAGDVGKPVIMPGVLEGEPLVVEFHQKQDRGGRRWDWLVPPVSGATSPLWNRTYDPTEYSPNFFVQTPAWG